jgi:hypothetical protein
MQSILVITKQTGTDSKRATASWSRLVSLKPVVADMQITQQSGLLQVIVRIAVFDTEL